MSLRVAVLILAGLVALGGGLGLFLLDFPSGFIFGLWGVIFAFGILFERSRYKNLESRAPGAGWNRTDERFIDDETGRPVRVYVEPITGERRYVQE